MDTGDSALDMAKPNQPPAGGKGKKKKKTKTVMSLDQFLAKTEGGSGGTKGSNWASMTENIEDDPDAPVKFFDRSTLPTAPKAAIGPSSVDLSLIPPNGPYSAYVGNLSYEANEDGLAEFFKELEIEKIRMILDQGRPRGYAYVDFMTKESLIEGLRYHDREFMGRNIRVDLASQKDNDRGFGGRDGGFSNRDRGGFGSSSEGRDPDRAEGNWRSGPREVPASNDRGGGFDRRDNRDSYDRRDNRDGYERRDNRDRGYGFGSDRDGGDRGGTWERGGDRGGDRGGAWDRGGGRDRGGESRDTGGTWERGAVNQGSDRDRGFGGDRDRGYGGDRDRGYGGDRDGPRDYNRGGYQDRRDGRDSYSRRDREDGGGRYGGFSRDDRGGRRDDFNRDRPNTERDAPAERPRLKLQPRSKPAEDNKEESQSTRSSIFGSAKPVDTHARETEIESKLQKSSKPEEKHAPVPRASIFGSAKPVDTYAREKEIEAKLKSEEPPSAPKEETNAHETPLSRQNSSTSAHSGDESIRSPVIKQAPKIVPAPLPKENPWGKKQFDTSNNAAPASSHPPAAPASKRLTPEKDEHVRGDAPSNRTNQAPRSNAWGRDRGPAHEGERRYNTDNRSRDYGRDKPKPVKEKHLPQHYDEMPKYEESKGADFAMKNKFAFLNEDEDEGNVSGENES